MSNNNLDTCKLCGQNAPLCQSHVYPDFYIWSLERTKPTGRTGQLQRFSILKSSREGVVDGEKQRGYWERVVGLKERLLCVTCERKLSVYEDYVRNLLYISRVTRMICMEPETGSGAEIETPERRLKMGFRYFSTDRQTSRQHLMRRKRAGFCI